jgi:hypothetical protein
VLGCDSIVNLNLILNSSYQDTINATICVYEQYLFNNLLINQAGSYQAFNTTTNGCDSNTVLNLTITPAITNTVTQSNLQLTTSGVGNGYQWIDCSSGLAIPNAVSNNYSPTHSGSYAAVVFYGTCRDTSACFPFVMTGIDELNSTSVSVRPNPFREELTISRNESGSATLEIYNLIGERILQKLIQDKTTTLSTHSWTTGIYIVKVISDRGVVTTKVVKGE